MTQLISASATNLSMLNSSPAKTGTRNSGRQQMNSASLSSTPHAPRQRRAFSFLSTHPSKGPPVVHRAHSYLDVPRIKSLSNVDTHRDKQGKTIKSEVDTKPNLVKPFRRVIGTKPPQCVPLLDLTRFNEPDEEMAPIELIHFPQPLEMTTQRTDISWGTPRLPSTIRTRLQEEKSATVINEDTRICDVEEDEVEEVKSVTIRPSILEENQLKYVEQRILSHERGRDERYLPQHKSTPKMGVVPDQLCEKALTKKLRFNARILSQNGRDIHRELCGFLFLADGSLTIYEFRQFGQRISALPLIPRSVYKHPLGKRCGEIYEIRHIKKGATLYFESTHLSSLPENMKRRKLLAIRISDVNEETKLNIMKEDIKPEQYHKIKLYLSQPLSDESERNNFLLQTLQGMLRNRLRGRSSQTLVGLGRHLKRCSSNGLVEKIQLQHSLRSFHISLTPEDFDQLWTLLLEEHIAVPIGEGHDKEGMWLDRIISGLVGDMKENRKAAVIKVFQKLDPTKSGHVSIVDMYKYFSPHAHPDVLSQKKTVEEVLHGVFGYLQPLPGQRYDNDSVTYADFEHYYDGVSIDIPSDREFITIIRQCWSV